MFKGSKTQLNSCFWRTGRKPSEFGLGSELGCNPDDLRAELAGYWSRPFSWRVKKQSEVRRREKIARRD